MQCIDCPGGLVELCFEWHVMEGEVVTSPIRHSGAHVSSRVESRSSVSGKGKGC